MNKKQKASILILSLITLGFFASNCLAIGSLVDTSGNYATGNYTLNDIREYAIYLIKLILGVVGSLSLLAFVYGGLTFLLSAGRADQIKKGTDILKAAVVGLLITFASVLIINVFFKGLGINWNISSGSVPINKAATK
ncbi:MAG: hypothetical protein WCK59_00195 [Candidatus Falkowbacteria bacterium]